MAATRLVQKRVEKVWGRLDLPQMFGSEAPGADPIGEIWFEHPRRSDLELLVKFLFTAQKLSIQVHPDDEAARSAGCERGKDEAWVLLRAEPGSELGIGLKRELSVEELVEAARDGSLEDLVDWRTVTPGDVYYSPAGTIHALGAGLSLVEIQQNCDLTYRLFDSGRPRELHVEAAAAVSHRRRYQASSDRYQLDCGREILADGGAFVLERWRGARSGEVRPAPTGPLWLVPLSGSGKLGEITLDPGNVFLLEEQEFIGLDTGCELLVAYPGGQTQAALVAWNAGS